MQNNTIQRLAQPISGLYTDKYERKLIEWADYGTGRWMTLWQAEEIDCSEIIMLSICSNMDKWHAANMNDPQEQMPIWLYTTTCLPSGRYTMYINSRISVCAEDKIIAIFNHFRWYSVTQRLIITVYAFRGPPHEENVSEVSEVRSYPTTNHSISASISCLVQSSNRHKIYPLKSGRKLPSPLM